MSDPADESEFSGAAEVANRLRAMGHERDAKTRIGGIINPQKIKLVIGDIIFRFGNKSRSVDDDSCGACWMTQATLMLNAEHAATVEGLINTMQQNLALPPAFSSLDRVFGATVRRRLSAFSGVGSGIWCEHLDARDRAKAPPLLLGGVERAGSSRGTSLRFQLFLPVWSPWGTTRWITGRSVALWSGSACLPARGSGGERCGGITASLPAASMRSRRLQGGGPCCLDRGEA